MRAKLHLVFDPLCAWCYAMKPFLTESRTYPGTELQLQLHPGLLFPEPTEIAQEYREHMRSADMRIAALTGLAFGDAYFHRLNTAPVLRYHSAPPAAAVMSFQQQSSGDALTMLETIQHAHYVDGMDVSDVHVLANLAEKLGHQRGEFLDNYTAARVALPARANQAYQLLSKTASHGFPSLILEIDGQLKAQNHSLAYSNPKQMLSLITQQMSV